MPKSVTPIFEGLINSQDRYREFMASVREYKFFAMCKQHGVEPREEMKPRSLVTLCPACPHIDINMDPGWRERPKELA